jgi:hypothetical protein
VDFRTVLSENVLQQVECNPGESVAVGNVKVLYSASKHEFQNL